MSWWSLRKDKKSRKNVDILTLYNIIRKYDICYYNIQSMPQPEKYVFYLYDYDLKYICECQGISSYDIRMLRKLFVNLYKYSMEVNEIVKIFGTPK